MGRQREFRFRTWGGARKGAGRKCAEATVPHRPREPFSTAHPVHVTWHVVDGLPSLRQRDTFAAVKAAFVAGKERRGFRLVHFSVQSNHLHLLVEADDDGVLSVALNALAVRIARAVNRVCARTGPVIESRCHVHVLRCPREVRNAVRYVLENELKHVERSDATVTRYVYVVDPCSSAAHPDAVAEAQTWLLRQAPAPTVPS